MLETSGYVEMFGEDRSNGVALANPTSDIAFVCHYFPEIC